MNRTWFQNTAYILMCQSVTQMESFIHRHLRYEYRNTERRMNCNPIRNTHKWKTPLIGLRLKKKKKTPNSKRAENLSHGLRKNLYFILIFLDKEPNTQKSIIFPLYNILFYSSDSHGGVICSLLWCIWWTAHDSIHWH